MGGAGGPQDDVTAHMWLNLAGVRNEMVRQVRDPFAERMTPEQLDEAQRRAREWLNNRR